jgi:hypothetical protein
MSALGRLSDEELRLDAPEVLTALIQHIRTKVSL